MDERSEPIEPLEGVELDQYRLPDGRPLRLFGVLAHSAAALADLKGATTRALQGTSLQVRHRELMILRILARFDALAEWQIHVAMFGDAAELTSDDLDALRGDGAAFTPPESVLLALADAVASGGIVSEGVWEALHACLADETVVDAVFVAAQYAKVALMGNIFEIAPPFAHGWELPRGDQASS